MELLKTPIDETKENLNADIGVSITAEPKQPGEEANAGSATVTSKTTNPYLPTGFTKEKDVKKCISKWRILCRKI